MPDVLGGVNAYLVVQWQESALRRNGSTGV